MHGRVADNTLFPDLFPAGFKLRLHKAGHTAAVLQDTGHRRKNQLQRNEADINGRKIQLIRDLFMA